MLLLVASNALESLPDRAGIVRKELAFEFAPVVSLLTTQNCCLLKHASSFTH